MIVYLDMDGVLYNWNKAAYKLMGVDYDDPIIQEAHKDNYDALDGLRGEENVTRAVLEAGADFWLSLEKFQWADDLYEGMVDTVGVENVYFCTSFGKWPEGASAKAKVLLRDFNSRRLVLIKDKYLLAKNNTILIDDKPSNTKNFGLHGGWSWEWENEFKFFRKDISPWSEIKALIEYVKYRDNHIK
jgi:5'(3')-deoxyribonucleotidase